MTIKGWHALDTKVLLRAAEGLTTASTIKEILLSLPASPGMTTQYLFHNIEPQVNSDFI